MAGNLTVIDRDSDEELVIDCTPFGTGAYSIPISVGHLRFESDAKFVLAIETAGMFQRLVKHSCWREADCILISMGGVPTRATRRFIRRLSDEFDVPVYAFVDCDPYGTCNIYRTLKVGSDNAGHINEFFCVPRARSLGATPDAIVDYGLPTHKLTEVDVKRHRRRVGQRPVRAALQALAGGAGEAEGIGLPSRAVGLCGTQPQPRHQHLSAGKAG